MASSGSSLANLIVRFIAETQPFLDGLKGMEDQTQKSSTVIAEIGKNLAEAIPFAAFAGEAFHAADTFEAATSRISRATGVTGSDLTALGVTFEEVFQNSAQPANDLAGALAIIEQKSGATGEALKGLATTAAQLATVTGQSLVPQVESSQKAFQLWGISVDDQKSKLDELLALSQKSGASIGTLTSGLQSAGPVLRQLGFDFDKSSQLLANFEAHGITTDKVVAALKVGLVNLANEGITNPQQALAAFIEKMEAAKNPLEAVELAAATFGKRGGSFFADAARAGAFDITAMAEAAAGSTGAIEKAADGAETFGEKLTKLGHAVEVAVEPLGKPMLEALSGIVQGATPAIKSAGDLFAEFEHAHPIVVEAAAGLIALAPAILIVGKYADEILLPVTALAGGFKALSLAIATVGVAQISELAAIAAPFAALAAAAAAAGYGIGVLGQKAGEARLEQINANSEWLHGVDSARILSHAVNDAGDSFQTSTSILLRYVASQKQAATADGEAALTKEQLAKALQQAEKDLSETEKAYKAFGASADDVHAAQMKVQSIMAQLHPDWAQHARDLSAATDAVLSLSSSDTMVTAAMMATQAGIAGVNDQTSYGREVLAAYFEASKNLDAEIENAKALWFAYSTTLSGTADAIDRLNHITDSMSESQKEVLGTVKELQKATTEEAKGIAQTTTQFKANSDLIKLHIPDLDELKQRIKDNDAAWTHYGQTAVPTATQALIYNIEKQKMAIDQAVLEGRDTTDLRIKLDATTEALRRQTLGFSELASQMKSTITGGLQTAFHDLLFDIGKVGSDFKALGENIVDVVANRIIKDALDPLLNVLDSVIAKGTKALEGVLGIGNPGKLSGVFSTPTTFPAGSNIGDLATNGDTIAGLGLPSAASSAASSASGLLGGIIGPIAAVGTLISSVIGNFQAARSETTLNAIEGNTRKSAIFLGEAEGASGIVQFTKQAAQRLQSIESRISDTLHPDLVAVRAAVSLFSSVVNGPAGSNGKTVDVGAILNGVVDVTEAYNQGLIHAIQVLDDNLGGKIDQLSLYVNQRLINIERDINKMANPPFWKTILGAGALFGSGIGGAGSGLGGLLNGLTGGLAGGIASGIGSAISAAFSGGEKDRLNIIANNIAVMNPDLHNLMLAGLTLSNDFKAFSGGFDGWYRGHLAGVEEWQDTVLMNLGMLIDAVKAPVISASQPLANGGTITIHIHESSDPQTTAQELMGLLKNYSPVFQG